MTTSRTKNDSRRRTLTESDEAAADQSESVSRGADSSPVEYSAKQIKALRERCGVSQTVFARYLGTTKGTVTQWEQDLRTPCRATHKLLQVVDRYGLKVLM